MFRELLQNSDDAQSKAVEIRFETQAFLERGSKREDASQAETSTSQQALPDLKTMPVRLPLLLPGDTFWTDRFSRYINGLLRTTA